MKRFWGTLLTIFAVLTLLISCQGLSPTKEVATRSPDVLQPSSSPHQTSDSPGESETPPSPQVIMTSPSGGQTIAAYDPVTIYFDQSMDSDIPSDGLQVIRISVPQPEDDSPTETESTSPAPVLNEITGEIFWSDHQTLVFIPDDPWPPGERYKLTLSPLLSADGLPLVDEFTLEIAVADELQVTQAFPNAKDVDQDSVITVVFNHPVVPLTTVENLADLPQPLVLSPSISGTGEWLNTSVYIFAPDEPLFPSTTYSAKIASGLTDILGSKLTTPYEWTFTTVAARVKSYGILGPAAEENPKNNQEDVRLDSWFYIDFQHPMESDSVAEAFSLASKAGDEVNYTLSWDTPTRVVISPTQDLELGTAYTMLLSPEAETSAGPTLQSGFRWNFTSVPAPSIESISPRDGTTQRRYSNRFSVKFATPMDTNTIESHISISPASEEGLSFYYNYWNNEAHFYGLAPSTDYTVRVDPGIQDIYSNTITATYQASFTTADIAPYAYLDLPASPVIYRVGGTQKFYASFVNLETLQFDLYTLSASTFSGFQNNTRDPRNYTPPEEHWVNSWEVKNERELNFTSHIGLPLETASGDFLPAGIYLLIMKSPQYNTGKYFDYSILVVAEANLTFKTTANEALVWLTDLNTGAPLEGVSLAIYNHGMKEIAQGATDSDGLLHVELPVEQKSYEQRFAITAEGEPFALAVSNWNSGVSPGSFGVWSNYYSFPDEPLAYVYTDRPLYRPGQPVYFKGIIRKNDDLAYSLLSWEEIEIEIGNYDEVIYKETIWVSEFGTFNGELMLDEEAALGSYYILVRYPGQKDETLGYINFSVAEYRKPEFQVSTAVTTANVLVGDTFGVTVNAEYYSGGALANAEVTWALSAQDQTFRPSGPYARYSFQDYDRYYYRYGTPSYDLIAQGSGQTDPSGVFTVSLTADMSAASNGRLLTFEASITDIAGTSVSDRTQIVVHPADYYPGVRAQRYVGRANTEQSFDLVVVDWDGNPVPGAVVDVAIVKQRWYSVWEADTNGYGRWVTSVEEEPVLTIPGLAMDSKGEGIANFTPETGGTYKARISLLDENGYQVQASAYTWISSREYVSWRQTDDRALELITDKDAYEPGDMAEIMIASPMEGDNYALVTVERGHIRETDVLQMDSNSMIYRLPITADMAPNTYLSVVVIQGAEVIGKPDFRMGIVELNVSAQEQQLTVEVIPDRQEAGPGEDVTYTIRTTNYAGNPVSAELSVGLSDLATLSLMDANALPILDFFYNRRSLSVRTAVPIVYSIEHFMPALEDRLTDGEGMGGGKGGGDAGVFEVRQDFPDTAFWDAHVVTDENGEATVTVTLPDNLTVWRLDARAITLDTRAGDATNDIRSTKPLLIRPQTPRFFVVGDQATLRAAVHNNTDEARIVDVTLQASGATLETEATQIVEIPARSQMIVTWEVEIPSDSEWVDLIFRADSGEYSDATRPTLGTQDNQGIPVYRYEAPETVGTAGVVTEEGSRTEGISIPASWNVTQGELTIELAPTLMAGMTAGLEYLKHYPHECVEQTISRFLPNVLTVQALKVAEMSEPTLEIQLQTQVNTALQRLSNWQHTDGGWGTWGDSEKSNSLTSAYVVLALVEAKAAGYYVNDQMLARGLRYLQRNVQSVDVLDKPYALNRQAFFHYVLARADKVQPSKLGELYEARQSLSLYAQAYLAEALWRTNPEDLRVQTLLSDLLSAAKLSATGAHWEEGWHDYWNWNTDTRTTAIVLATLIEIDPDNELNANAVRWLMSNRTEDRWYSTQETAWSLMTLVNWLEATGELHADYDWAVDLNGTQVGAGTASADNLDETVDLEVDVTELFMDEVNRLSVSHEAGPGNLYYSAHLEVNLPVDKIQALDRGIVVSRSYYRVTEEGEETAVTSANQGDLLLARLTIVVPQALHYVVIDDPLPAGLEAVDEALNTNPDLTAPQHDDWNRSWRYGWRWWYFNHIELRDERVVLSADYLPAGTYVYTYIVRASTQGEYNVIPPTAQEFYFAEVYGRGAGSKFTVLP